MHQPEPAKMANALGPRRTLRGSYCESTSELRSYGWFSPFAETAPFPPCKNCRENQKTHNRSTQPNSSPTAIKKATAIASIVKHMQLNPTMAAANMSELSALLGARATGVGSSPSGSSQQAPSGLDGLAAAAAQGNSTLLSTLLLQRRQQQQIEEEQAKSALLAKIVASQQNGNNGAGGNPFAALMGGGGGFGGPDLSVLLKQQQQLQQLQALNALTAASVAPTPSSSATAVSRFLLGNTGGFGGFGGGVGTSVLDNFALSKLLGGSSGPAASLELQRAALLRDAAAASGAAGLQFPTANMPGTGVGGERKRKGRTGTFPQKLHQMLTDLERQEGGANIASFLPHGRAFAIHKPRDFVKHVMPKYFRMSRFSSFQRQLNLYDFQRITDGSDKGAYFHQLFIANRPILSTMMKRNKIKGVKLQQQQAKEELQRDGKDSAKMEDDDDEEEEAGNDGDVDAGSSGDNGGTEEEEAGESSASKKESGNDQKKKQA